MILDEKVEQLLPKINHIPDHFWRIYESRFGKDDEGQGDNIEHLYRYMRDKRLIEPGMKEEEYIVLILAQVFRMCVGKRERLVLAS